MKFSLSVVLAALGTTAVHAQEGDTILDVVSNSPDHSSLEAAVLAADPSIATLLSDADQQLTLFAPDDDAFETLPAETVDLLLTEPWMQHLTCVLTGHVYTGDAVPSTDITEPLTVDSALSGYNLSLTVDDETEVVSVNGIAVTGADIEASNGVIHSLSDGVLLPACVTENLATLAAATPALSTLVSLVQDADLLDVLTEAPTAEGITILAPTDEAFAAVPPQVLEYLADNTDALIQVLQYHIVPTNYDGSLFGDFPTLLTGETIEVTTSEGDDGTTSLMINGATVTTPNLLASNGVVHLIDAVLLPASVEIPVQLPTGDAGDNSTMPDDSTMPDVDAVTETLLQVVQNSSAHVTLAAAVAAADPSIAALLDNDMEFLTVFAPDEEAFAALPDGMVERLTSDPWKQHLDCLLMGHVYKEGAVQSGSITGAMTVDSLAPAFALDLDVDAEGMVTVNGIPVDQADIQAINGVIHSLSEGVLTPACVANDLTKVMGDRPDFADLVNLAKASGMLDAFDQTPTADGMTILVPTNAALGKIDSVVLAGLAATNMDALTGLLEYHILPVNFDGKTTGTFTTKQGEDITVKRMSDGRLMINGAKVLEENILAANGVIHVLDSVLIPPSLAGTPGLPDTSGGGDHGDDHSGHDHGGGMGGDSDAQSTSGAAGNIVASALVASIMAGVAALAL